LFFYNPTPYRCYKRFCYTIVCSSWKRNTWLWKLYKNN